MTPFTQRNFGIKVGDAIPSANVSIVKSDANGEFSSEIVDTSEYFALKNVVLVGYPGAFTPTCMAKHIPEFIENAKKIKA
jgi:alkyl hydroperoxide reductase 1